MIGRTVRIPGQFASEPTKGLRPRLAKTSLALLQSVIVPMPVIVVVRMAVIVGMPVVVRMIVGMA